jgi:hypothetical protein
VPGRISVCVYPAPVKSFPGTVQASHSALLWLKVSSRSLIALDVYLYSFLDNSYSFVHTLALNV